MNIFNPSLVMVKCHCRTTVRGTVVDSVWLDGACKSTTLTVENASRLLAGLAGLGGYNTYRNHVTGSITVQMKYAHYRKFALYALYLRAGIIDQ